MKILLSAAALRSTVDEEASMSYDLIIIFYSLSFTFLILWHRLTTFHCSTNTFNFEVRVDTIGLCSCLFVNTSWTEDTIQSPPYENQCVFKARIKIVACETVLVDDYETILLRDCSSMMIGFNMNNKHHTLPMVYTILV